MGLALRQSVSGVNLVVQAATAGSALPNTSYSNPSAGVGDTISPSPAVALGTIDGYSPSVGDRILVKDQASAFQNGVYIVNATASPYLLTRAPDYDQPYTINNMGSIAVINGTVNAVSSWQLNSIVSAVGTSTLSFVQTGVNPALAGGGGRITILPWDTSSVGAGTWKIVPLGSNTTSPFFACTFINTTQTSGDTVYYKFSCQAGTYTIQYWTYLGPNQGTWAITYDGGIALMNGDSYVILGSTSYNHPFQATGLIIPAGIHTLEFQVTGKNAASSNYYANMQEICLWRTA